MWSFSEIIINITEYGEDHGESITVVGMSKYMKEQIYTHIIMRQF